MDSNSKKGLWIFGGLGCLWLLIIFVLGAVMAGLYFYSELNKKDDYNYNYNYNYNTNFSSNTNTGSDQQFDGDGTSLGFPIEDGFVDENLYAYQIGAFADMANPDTEWPAFRFTVKLPDNVSPMQSDADTGSLWVGAVLDNDYFVQVGMMSSTMAETDGTMAWNYFWEMWNDQDVYQYGLQDDLAPYLDGEDPVFTLTCQDPATGEWQFWVNDQTVGKTYTGDCSVDMKNAYIFWEMTTDKTNKATLPVFGPFTLKNFEYWDGYNWLPVSKSYLSYSYGRVVDGTQRDQAGVCPPYGAEVVEGKAVVRFGSGLGCPEIDTILWE